MFKGFYPDNYVSSVYDVDFKEAYIRGFRGVIFDIDNTLVPHDAPADEKAIEFFASLSEIGFKTLLLSNNAEPRVKNFYEAVKADGYVFKAQKPSIDGYLKATEIMGITPESAIFCGDQIFTDILGAKRAGIMSIMVKPIKKWQEPIQIILKRILEPVVLLGYKRAAPLISLKGE